MYKYFVAFRYLTSRPISLVSIIGIFLSVGALIVVISVMSGFLRDTKAFIRGTMSDFVVTPRRILLPVGDRFEYGGYPSFEEMRDAIKTVPEVTGVAPRFVRPAMIRPSDGPDPFVGSTKFSDLYFTKALGVDPDLEREVSRFEQYLTSLENPASKVDNPDEPFFISDEVRRKNPRHFSADYPSILIGEDKFDRLALRKGDVITLATLDAGSVKERLDRGQDIKAFEQKFFVSGAFRSGNHQFDMSFVVMEMGAAWNWVGVEDEISEIYVSVEHYERNKSSLRVAIMDALESQRLPARVETWEERNAIFLGAVQNERTILGVILAFFILIATFNVYATISMMVTDKTKDIGILVSMGATSFGIMGTFVICGLWMWLIGSMLGSIGGYLFAANINPIKDFIETLFGIQVFNKNVYNFKDIPVEISPLFIGVIVAGTFLLCLFFSLLPALRASWMDPVKALRHE